MHCDKILIEWEPIDGDVVWKTNLDDLKRVLIKNRRCLQLIYKFDEANLDYFFPRGNARAFVRMLEAMHCVKYKWNPIPFVMQFSIVEKPKAIRDFPDFKIEHISDRKHIERKRKMETLKRNGYCINHSAMKLKAVKGNRYLKTKNASFLARVFRRVKIIYKKIADCPLFWAIVATMGRAAVNAAARLVKAAAAQSPFIQKICGAGITTKIFGATINFNLAVMSSVLTEAYRAVKYICNDGFEEMQTTGTRYLV